MPEGVEIKPKISKGGKGSRSKKGKGGNGDEGSSVSHSINCLDLDLC
jgi:formamidopyrimidine-DNA glycosylase